MGRQRQRRRQELPNDDKESNNNEKDLVSRLCKLLLSSNLVSSVDEAECVADTIVAEIVCDDGSHRDNDRDRDNSLISGISETLGVSLEEGKSIVRPLLSDQMEDEQNDEDDHDQHKTAGEEESDDDDDSNSDDDGEIIGEGECELCERFISLTKHHLIPRSTWNKMMPRLQNSADFLEHHREDKARTVLGHDLEHLLEPLKRINQSQETKRKSIKRIILQISCDICRPCHSQIHRAHDNWTLAQHYSTVGLLLKDESIYKFCQWASKQRPGKYAVK